MVQLEIGRTEISNIEKSIIQGCKGQKIRLKNNASVEIF